MKRTPGLRIVLVLAMFGVALLGATRQASAFGFCCGWWHRPYWGGYVSYYHAYPSYVSYYSYRPCCYDPCCYGCYSYSTSYGCCGYVSYAPCCSPSIEVPAAPAAPAQPTPAPAPAPQPTPASPSDAPPAADATTSGGALLKVQVPPAAQVFVNGRATTSAGAQRQFLARNLAPGKSYTFEVRAAMERDGQTLSETKTVRIAADQTANMVFRFEASDPGQPAEPAPRTMLTVHVPSDAKVWLAGNPTRSTGVVRRYATTRLAAGQTWEDYRVRVAVDRAGKLLTAEKTLTLHAGQDQEVRFELETARVAEGHGEAADPPALAVSDKY